jgi:hypothetical protein
LERLWGRIFILEFALLHESFLLARAFSLENEEISSPPPCGFLIGIYKFFKSWSTETFRKKELKRRSVCTTYKALRLDSIKG